MTSTRPAPGAAAPSAARLTLLHARYHLVSTLRLPIAVVGTVAFPALVLLFFVVPQPFAQVPGPATAATVQISVVAIMSVCLFTFGVGVAEDRERPWDGFVRTLPTGAVPRLLGVLLSGMALAALSLVPVALLAWALTAATLPVERLLLTLAALLAAGVPLIGLGAAIGYRLPAKAALAVAQSLLLPLAFAGGLFLPPELFPDWLDTLSLGLVTRAGRDLAIGAATGADLPPTTLPVLAAWSLATAAMAVAAYRRDEGRRFT